MPQPDNVIFRPGNEIIRVSEGGAGARDPFDNLDSLFDHKRRYKLVTVAYLAVNQSA